MRSPWRWAFLFLWLSLPSATSAAVSFPVDEYVDALRLVAAGNESAARVALESIVREAPTWIPVNRALALLAIRSGRIADYDARLAQRLEQNPRDAGAAVGHALLLAASGQRVDAHRWLQAAIVAGSRDPLLVEPLVDTASSRERLIVWLVGEATRATQDAPLAALAARVSLAAGDRSRARLVVNEALKRHPGFGDLHSLDAQLALLDGDERTACDAAALAAGYLTEEHTVPELRVPRRVALARTFTACGRLNAARQLLPTVGPVLRVPGEEPWPSLVRMANAEIAIAAGDPLAALVLINDEGPLVADSEGSREWLGSLRASAYARLGRPIPNAEALTSELPVSPTALIDRLSALSALWLAPAEGRPKQSSAAVDQVAIALESLGLTRRAARAWLLSAFVAEDREAGRRALGNALVLVPDESAPAELRAAVAVVRTHQALGEERLDGAVAASRIDPARVSGAPGVLLARLELMASEATLTTGDADGAIRHARDGILELQEAERSTSVVPIEFAPLVDDPSDTALALAALSFRATRATGVGFGEAGATLLRQLRRGVRRWSLFEAQWPETLDDLARLAPKNACLVVAAPGRSAPALVAANGSVEETTSESALKSASCRDVRAVLWAGPAPAPVGLATGSRDSRVVVRLIGPAPISDGPLGETSALQPAWNYPVGSGTDRPLVRLLEKLAQARSPSVARSASDDESKTGNAFFVGAGLAPPRSPLSSGWLVPPTAGVRQGWLAPESLTGLAGDPAAGLIAVGIRAETPIGADRGLWLLAEGSLAAGWRWVLLSRIPLSEQQRAEIATRSSEWMEDPIREARRLARLDPQTAAALQLWSASGRLLRVKSGNPIDTLFYVPMVAGIVLAALTLMRLFRRSRRARRLSVPQGPRDPRNSADD
ncbi:MAG: hypothetical protein U0V87_00685 [Acidobacteriota bacterium]